MGKPRVGLTRFVVGVGGEVRFWIQQRLRPGWKSNGRSPLITELGQNNCARPGISAVRGYRNPKSEAVSARAWNSGITVND